MTLRGVRCAWHNKSCTVRRYGREAADTTAVGLPPARSRCHLNSVVLSQLLVVPEAPCVSTDSMSAVVGSLHLATLIAACFAIPQIMVLES